MGARSSLPPLWLGIVVVGDLALLAGLSVLVSHDATASWDLAINAAFGPYRTGAPITVFLWVTNLGAGGAVIAVMVAVTGMLWALRRSRLIIPYWVAFLGTELLTWGLKFALGRVRPVFLPEIVATSPSFPSAHTSAATAVYGFLAVLIAHEAEGPGRLPAVMLAVVVIGAIGFSRMFLSVHYVSDVIGGILVAVPWIAIGYVLIRRIEAAPGGGG